MSESIVNVTEGSGKKLHTDQKTIGANTVEDEYILHGEPFLATYACIYNTAASAATANSHMAQLMAGASLNLYIRRISVYQVAVATTAAIAALQIFRVSTAGTGGTAFTPTPMSTESASGATAMTLPTVKGTEGTLLGMKMAQWIQTVPTGGVGTAPLLAEWDFERLRGKAIRVPAGTTNGIVIKNPVAVANATIITEIIFTEANY